MPSIWKDLLAKLRNVIEEHFKRVSVIVEEHESALSPYLRETKDAVIGVKEIVNSKVRMAIGRFQKRTDALSSAIDSIRASMGKHFAQCKDITGEKRFAVRCEGPRLTRSRQRLLRKATRASGDCCRPICQLLL